MCHKYALCRSNNEFNESSQDLCTSDILLELVFFTVVEEIETGEGKQEKKKREKRKRRKSAAVSDQADGGHKR